jgi:RNA 2',3'-cyclic 3'-phosphodiesterase
VSGDEDVAGRKGPRDSQRVAGQEGDERVRLFVALELPEEARDALVRWRSRLRGEARDLRLIAREDLHATLCFLGWRSSREIAAIRDACKVLVAQTVPRVRLGDAIWLPPPRPRVLAVALQDGSGALARMQSVLSEALTAGGWYEPERRPYLSHVTVARAGRGSQGPGAGRRARGSLPPPPALEFRAAFVTLYRSRLLPAGARYEALARIELRTA